MHIFNQVQIYALPSWYCWVLFGIGSPVFIIGAMLMDKCKRPLIKFIGGTVFVITFASMMIFGAGWQMFEQPTGRYEYTVSIEDPKVNVLEFNSKYEIVRQEGELWIIRDK